MKNRTLRDGRAMCMLGVLLFIGELAVCPTNVWGGFSAPSLDSAELNKSKTRVELEWDCASNSDIYFYEIDWSGCGASGTRISSQRSIRLDVKMFPQDCRVRFRVRGYIYEIDDFTSYSNSKRVTIPKRNINPPAAPSWIRVTPAQYTSTNETVSVSWAPVSDASSYVVDRYWEETSAGPWEGEKSTSITFKPQSDSKYVKFRVSSFNAGGQGPWTEFVYANSAGHAGGPPESGGGTQPPPGGDGTPTPNPTPTFGSREWADWLKYPDQAQILLPQGDGSWKAFLAKGDAFSGACLTAALTGECLSSTLLSCLSCDVGAGLIPGVDILQAIAQSGFQILVEIPKSVAEYLETGDKAKLTKETVEASVIIAAAAIQIIPLAGDGAKVALKGSYLVKLSITERLAVHGPALAERTAKVWDIIDDLLRSGRVADNPHLAEQLIDFSKTQGNNGIGVLEEALARIQRGRPEYFDEAAGTALREARMDISPAATSMVSRMRGLDDEIVAVEASLAERHLPSETYQTLKNRLGDLVGRRAEALAELEMLLRGAKPVLVAGRQIGDGGAKLYFDMDRATGKAATGYSLSENVGDIDRIFRIKTAAGEQVWFFEVKNSGQLDSAAKDIRDLREAMDLLPGNDPLIQAVPEIRSNPTAVRYFVWVNAGERLVEVAGGVGRVAANLITEPSIAATAPPLGYRYAPARRADMPGANGIFSPLPLLALRPEAELAQEVQNLDGVRLYPNPYRVDRDPDQGLPYDPSNPNSGVVVDNLPDDAHVTVLSVAGELIRAFAAPQGRVHWDLRNNAGVPVGSGVYLTFVDSARAGRRTMKLGVIR